MQQIEDELARGREDALYFEEQRETLLARYPNHWIAVYDKEVVGTARELRDLLLQLDERGVPRSRVFLEYLSTDKVVLVLHAE